MTCTKCSLKEEFHSGLCLDCINKSDAKTRCGCFGIIILIAIIAGIGSYINGKYEDKHLENLTNQQYNWLKQNDYQVRVVRFSSNITRHRLSRANSSTYYTGKEIVLVEGIKTKDRGYYIYTGYPGENEVWEVSLNGGDNEYWCLSFNKKTR